MSNCVSINQQPISIEMSKLCKFHLVTSLSQRLWDKYANQTVGSFIAAFDDGFPDDVDSFMIWLDSDSEVQPFIENLGLSETVASKYKFGSLNTLNEYIIFERMYGGNVPLNERGINPEKIPAGSEFRFNYLPFAKKVFSWAASYMSLPENDFLVWIDADIMLHRKFDTEFFKHFVDFDLVFLDRDFPWYAAETGFFILKRTPEMDRFVQLMLHVYISGFVFDMAEWHDGYVFKTLMKIGVDPNLKVLNLNRTMRERDVFERTLLADFMEHKKGQKKNILKQGLGMDSNEPPTLINFDPENQ